MTKPSGIPDDSKALLAELLGSEPRWFFTVLTLLTMAASVAAVFDETVVNVANELLPFSLGRAGVVALLSGITILFGLHAAANWRSRIREQRNRLEGEKSGSA